MKKFKLFLCTTCILVMGCFVLAACGNDNGSTSGNNTQDATNNGENTNTGDNAGDAIDDAGNAIGDAVDDVAEGIGDAAEDITSGFTNYGDAHDYFMNRMGQENTSAQYELRNESEDLTTYDGKNQGYHFELYDTATNSDGEKVGDFYLEPESGKIYKKDASSGDINEYQFSNANEAATGDNTNQ